MNIVLDAFKPRDYQKPLVKALEVDKYRHLIAIWPRRAGKDILALNLAIRMALRKVIIVYYIFPTYTHAKKAVFDGIDISGKPMLDFIPKELIASCNSQEMKIRLINGSIIQWVGSDNADSLVGTNPYLCIFSEFAIQDPTAAKLLRPVLAANGGIQLYISTPRGKNHFFDLYQMASKSPDWFTNKLTLNDTKHIPLEEVERDRREGIMSEELIQQEYYTSFVQGVEGSYYRSVLDRMRTNYQIGIVPWNSGQPVHTSWDIGRDMTSIILFQLIGSTVNIIDCIENSKEGLEYYVKILQAKPYVYGKHIGPHDIAVKEWAAGMSRIEKARDLGINFVIAPRLSIEDGIEAVRSILSRTYIHEINCAKLLKALENYRQEYDHKLQVYSAKPLHDWSSHMSDSMRYLAISLHLVQQTSNAKALDERFEKVMMGASQQHLPKIFRTDVPQY